MGSSKSQPDPNAQIYTTLNKKVYFAGEVVEGVTHINCTADRPYDFLQIRINGKEHTRWSRSGSKTTTVYYSDR